MCPTERRLRAVRWDREDIIRLEEGMNAAGNCHDFALLQQYLPARTIASITKKVNTLLGQGKISVRAGRYSVSA